MEKAFNNIIKDSAESVKLIATATREKILEIAPDSVEIIWGKAREAGYGFGPKKLTEHHTRILLNKSYVTLMFEHGVSLEKFDEKKYF